MCLCEYRYSSRPEEGAGYPEARVTDGCELHNLGARNQTYIFCKCSKYSWPPQPPHPTPLSRGGHLLPKFLFTFSWHGIHYWRTQDELIGKWWLTFFKTSWWICQLNYFKHSGDKVELGINCWRKKNKNKDFEDQFWFYYLWAFYFIKQVLDPLSESEYKDLSFSQCGKVASTLVSLHSEASSRILAIWRVVVLKNVFYVWDISHILIFYIQYIILSA